MLSNREFRPENDQKWTSTDKEDEVSDLSFRYTEIQPGLTSKFYDFCKPEKRNKDHFSFEVDGEKNMRLGFQSQPKPWLPPTVLDMINKLRKGIIDSDEMTNLMEKIAEISIDFYKIGAERFIALRFDGRVVEDANSEIELLLKIQG
jgi:hypothetical protein